MVPLIDRSAVALITPLEIVFQEQSYSSLHSGWSLAWDHLHGTIADPSGDWWLLSRRSMRDSLNIIKHCETRVKHRETHVKHREPLVKHHETLVKHYETLKHSPYDVTILALDAAISARGDISAQRCVSGNIGNCSVGITPQMSNRVTNP